MVWAATVGSPEPRPWTAETDAGRTGFVTTGSPAWSEWRERANMSHPAAAVRQDGACAACRSSPQALLAASTPVCRVAEMVIRQRTAPSDRAGRTRSAHVRGRCGVDGRQSGYAGPMAPEHWARNQASGAAAAVHRPQATSSIHPRGDVGKRDPKCRLHGLARHHRCSWVGCVRAASETQATQVTWYS
jgi:hypothetical protein